MVVVPPAASIFSFADLLKACAETLSFFVTSPSPSTLTRAFFFRTTPASTSFAIVTSEPAAKSLRVSRFTGVDSTRKMFVKPRMWGRRLISGSCPPSNRNGTLPRCFCPLEPRPENVPVPDPLPRPTRFRSRLEFFDGFSWCSPGISKFLLTQ